MTDLKSMSLGRRIQSLRKQQGLTQDALAEIMGISPQAVSKWENSQSCPDIMTLPLLARQLDVTIDQLLTGEDPAAPAAPSKKPEELIVRMAFTEEDGSRICCNLPFTVFRLTALHGMLTITYNSPENGEIDMNAAARLKGLDLRTISQMIESGVTGKLLEQDDDGTKLTIWTE